MKNKKIGSSQWIAFLAAGLLASAVGCGGGGKSKEQLATEICETQISCEYQLLDQSGCETLFVSFFDQAQLEACSECLETNAACEGQRDACQSSCTLTGG